MKNSTKIIAGVVVVAILAFAWWIISPLFIDKEVQEEIAIDLSGIDVSERANDTGFDQVNETISGDFDSQQVIVDRVSSNENQIQTFEPGNEDPTITTRETPPQILQTSEPAPAAEPDNTPRVLSGSFNPSETSYNISGQVYVSGQDLSLVNFDSRAVPDGRVYLANDFNGNDFVDLGALKGNKGNQNYSIPSSLDIDDYKYVVIWCRAFSVFMGSAEIQ